MKKLLIYSGVLASALSLASCGRWVERLPFVYHVDVQQGNLVTQAQVDRLRPGMTPAQVRYVMGTPLVRDVFHDDRWDYVYLFHPGKGKGERKRVTLFFKDGRLARIEGDLRPTPAGERRQEKPRSTIVVVPPHERKPRGVLSRLWRWIVPGKHAAE